MNPNLFMYYEVDNKIPISKVEGWSEKDLLTTLGADFSEGRKFYIQVYDESPLISGIADKSVGGAEEVLIDVEVDIHFFESLMKAVQQSGYMNTGIRKTFSNKTTAKLEKKQIQKVLNYLSQHNTKSDIKFPRNTIKLFLSALYESPRYFYIIEEFEKKVPEVIKMITDKKINYRTEKLDEEYSNFIDRIQNKFSERKDKVKRVYGLRIDKAWIDGDDGNVDILENLLGQEMDKIDNELGDSIIRYNDSYQKRIDSIKKYSYPTYAFKLYDFDILVAKVNQDTLRLRTIYADNMKTKPSNCFLFIDDYMDIKTK